MSYMGIDVGTNGCKTTVISESGEIIYSDARQYSLNIYDGDRAELSPQLIWNAYCTLVRKAAKSLKNRDPIKAISHSILGEAITPIDSKGNFLDNTLVSMDYRGRKQNSHLTKLISPYDLFLETGQIHHPMYPISKIMWWRENKRQMYKKTWKFLGWEDYLAYKLCGKPIISHSLASRTMLFNLKNRNWSSKILNLVDLPADKLPELVESGKQIDTIHDAQFSDCNLYDKAVLISGGWDQACAALGAGAITEDVLLDSFGTTMCYGTVLRKLIMNRQVFSGGYQLSRFLFGNRYFLNGGNLNGGILLKWFQEKVAHEAVDGKHLDFNPANMYFFPNFAGSGTPAIDPVSCGGMLNLNYETDADQIHKSILESLCFELKRNVRFLETLTGNSYSEIVFVGGGSKSEYVCQLKSHILGKKVGKFFHSDSSPIGAALLALAGVKGWKHASSIIDDFHKRVVRYRWRKSINGGYEKKYRTYMLLSEEIRQLANKYSTIERG